jgi:hypothetical protein
MPARLLLVAVSLALAASSHAAPAPLPRPTQRGPHAPVQRTGQTHVKFTGTLSVTRTSDWETFARTLGIKDPPRVDFRTHFLFVHGTPGDDPGRSEIDGAGDLRVVRPPAKRGMKFLVEEPANVRYLIKSFPRSAVRTVSGRELRQR